MLEKIKKKIVEFTGSKQDAELFFWQEEIKKYSQWFNGELSPLYETVSPTDEQKEKACNLKDASILTWHKLHQEVKYLEDLQLQPNAFEGLKLLDIGSGPMPSATCFKGCRLYCLEPLLPRYLQVGFPLHYYGNVSFVHAPSERIPVEDDFFDAVISVNAIDHVDDIKETAAEIKRVLKPDGLLRLHVHYHPASKCEPVNLNDTIMQELFGWCKNFEKIQMSQKNHTISLPENESFALWSNFK